MTEKEKLFAREYISPEYFNVDKILSYLEIHDKVGDEIFDISLKSNNKINIRLVGNHCGYNTIDTKTFIKRIPFYFYVADYDKDQHGNLVSLFRGNEKVIEPDSIEEIYVILERLFYSYNISIVDIMSYPVIITGLCNRNDIFLKWANYLDLCNTLNIDNKFPIDFLNQYNKVLESAKQLPIIYEPGLIGFNEYFLRNNKEIVISGEFPCDENNNPILKWIGLWIENAKYIKAKDTYSYDNTKTINKEIHIGLSPITKIFMPNIYNTNDNEPDTWYPIYLGPQIMKFDKKALRFFRENFGATQREVAEAVGVDTRTYQKWEKGDSVPDGHNLIRLMNFLNIETVQDFIEATPIIDNEFKLFRTRKSYN